MYDQTITADLFDNGKFVKCSLLSRAVFIGLVIRCDAEGREVASASRWLRRLALAEGGCSFTPSDVELAIVELHKLHLVRVYTVDGKTFLYLPGRFEHNKERPYWRKSKFPLPPDSELVSHAEYLRGLAMLTTKGRLVDLADADAPRRYARLTKVFTQVHVSSREFTHGPEGNGTEYTMEGGDNLDALRDVRCAPPRKVSVKSWTMITDMCAERGVCVDDLLTESGIKADSITARDVTRLKRKLKGIDVLDERKRREHSASAEAVRTYHRIVRAIEEGDYDLAAFFYSQGGSSRLLSMLMNYLNGEDDALYRLIDGGDFDIGKLEEYHKGVKKIRSVQ